MIITKKKNGSTKKSPLAAMQPSTRFGFLIGARWARRGERRFEVPRPGSDPLWLEDEILADHEAMVAVEGHQSIKKEEYA